MLAPKQAQTDYALTGARIVIIRERIVGLTLFAVSRACSHYNIRKMFSTEYTSPARTIVYISFITANSSNTNLHIIYGVRVMNDDKPT